MVKKKQPSKQTLRNVLLESLFDPRANGPMKIIVDMDDAYYCEIRAIEFIQEAVEAGKNMHFDNADYEEQYHQSMNKAIGLLALARILKGYTPDAAKT